MPQETEVKKVAIWVRISNLLAKLYNGYFLWKLEKTMDTMLRTDELTSIHSRGKFAHICVEIDLRNQLVSFFTAFGKEFHLVYEGLHQICFHCGRYGDKVEGCTEVEKQPPREKKPLKMAVHPRSKDPREENNTGSGQNIPDQNNQN
ncbi:hypothetical protein AHAS_Ahas12G0129600 [Arachis hypogaea]